MSLFNRFVSLPLNEFYFIQQDNFQLSNLRMITYKNWSVNTRCTVVISITPLHPALYKTVIEIRESKNTYRCDDNQ